MKKIIILTAFVLIFFGINAQELSPQLQWIRGGTYYLNSIKNLEFNRDSSLLASIDENGNVKIYDINSKLQVPWFTIEKSSKYFCFHPDNKSYFIADKDNSIKIKDLKSGKVLDSLVGHKEKVCKIKTSIDGKILVSGDKGGTIILWDIASLSIIKKISAFSDYILDIVLSPDGSKFAAFSYDKAFKTWDLKTGKSLKSFKSRTVRISAITFSNDGGKIITDGDKKVVVWDANTAKEIASKEMKENINAVAVSPDNKYIAVAEKRNVNTYTLDGLNWVKNYPNQNNDYYVLAFLKNGQTLIGGSDEISLWDVQTAKELNPVTTLNGIHEIKFVPDGSLLSAVGSEGVTFLNVQNAEALFYLNTASYISHLDIFENEPKYVIVEQDEKYLQYNNVGIYNYLDFKLPPKRFKTHEARLSYNGNDYPLRIKSLKIIPGQERVLIANDMQTIKIFDFYGKQIGETQCSDHFSNIDVSSDSKYFIGSTYHSLINVWDLSTLKLERSIDANKGCVYCAVFSPDAKNIASIGKDSVIMFFETSSWKHIKSIEAPMMYEGIIKYSPDGKYIALAGKGNIVYFYEVVTGKQILKLIYPGNVNVCYVDFSSDGKYFAMSTADNSIMLWKLK